MQEKNKSQDLQKLEASTFLTTTTQKYFNQLALMNRETTQIRDIKSDDVEWRKIRSALNQASLLIGASALMTNDEYFMMKDFLTTDGKDFSAEEILIAFKKLAAKTITVNEQHFGKLSAVYLGSVLKAFREHRHKALAQELKSRPKVEKEATEEEKKKIREEFLQRCLFKPYDEIEYSGTFDIDLHTCSTLFRLFRRASLIECTPEDGEKYEPLAIKSLEQEYKKDPKTNRPLRTFWERIHQMQKGKDQPISNRVTDRCQALYFVDYVLDLKSKNRDIRKIAERL